MADEFLARVRKIAAEVLNAGNVETTARGEGYYAFSFDTGAGRSSLPPVWIEPGASEAEIREKLERAFSQDFYPDSAPDDLSVPGLATEGKVRP